MDSKIISVVSLFAAIFTLACSASPSVEGKIGSPLEETSDFFTVDGQIRKNLHVVDTFTKRLLRFDGESLNMAAAFDIASNHVNPTVSCSVNESYCLVYSTKNLEVIKSDGTRVSKPFDFQGTPVSAAFHQGSGFLAMKDDLGSIGVLQLDAAGNIVGSWLGGPALGNTESIFAGEFDLNGRLIVTGTLKTIGIIDVGQSIQQKKWVMTTFTTDLENINWIAADADHPNLMLAKSEEKLAVINLVSQSITSQEEIKNLFILKSSKFEKPHIILGNRSGVVSMWNITSDGSVGKADGGTIGVSSVLASVYDRSEGYLDVVVNPSENPYSNYYSLASSSPVRFLESDLTFYRIRLFDRLVIKSFSFKAAGKVVLSPTKIMVIHDSHLGRVDSVNISDENRISVTGYNFELLRSRHALK